MHQTKLESFLEAALNIATGFIISFLMWMFVVAPLFGFDSNYVDNLLITTIFTVTSLGRSYVWRRFFNAGIHKFIYGGYMKSWNRFKDCTYKIFHLTNDF